MGQILSTLPLIGGRRQSLPNSPRLCRFEQLERRELLAADLTTGFADVPLVSPGGATASVSGTVFSAHSANCWDQAVASPQANARVQLLDATGHVLEERLTGEKGAYQFVDLLPGQYAVRQMTSHGFLDGAAVAGTGGGVAFDAYMVGEIVVYGGEDLEGYDFCDVVSATESAGPVDVPIVPHQTVTIDEPFLPPAIPLMTTSSSVAVGDPSFQLTLDSTPHALPPLITAHIEASYSGGGRSLEQPTSIKTWDEFQFDDWFSTTTHLEIAATDLPTIEALGSIIGPAESTSDIPFADGYTFSSVEWWEEPEEVDLSEVIDESETSGQDIAHTERASTQVARRAGPRHTD